jgi:Flp pilus assembly protein TadG
MRMAMKELLPTGKRQRIGTLLLRPLLGGSSGSSLVELALIMPVFTLLLAGAAEFSRLAYFGNEVMNAAHAGAAYGAQTSATASNTAAIQAAASNDAPNLTAIATLTTTPTIVCTCSNGTAITCANAATTCLSPARTIKFVQVRTSAPVSTPFSVPGLPTSFTLRGKAVMRIERP